MAMEIPVIDLKDLPVQLPGLRKACEEWGCFRIVNHNISSDLLSDMKSVVRSLLDLPMEIKRRNADSIVGSGYVPPNPNNPLYEALGLYDVSSSDDVAAFCSQLDASPHQSETIKAYAGELVELGMEVGRKIAESVGLLESDLFKGWPCQLRLNKYSFTEQTVGSLGVQMHTDSGFLTILQEDDCIGGLQVMDKTGASFVAVDPLPGSLLVNLGDVAQAWSNGLFCNVKHRVRCKEAGTRVSIAMFVLGPMDGGGVVEAPGELVDSNNPRLYRPFSFEDYRKLRLSTGMRAGEALPLYYLSTRQQSTD